MSRCLSLTFIAVFMTASLAFSAASAQNKIAFVDMQRALLEVDEGKSAKATLEKLKGDKQKELDGQQDALRKLQSEFEAQKAFMKEDVRRSKEEEFRTKLGELQLTYAKLQKELAGKEAELTKDIFARMAKILNKMGQDQKWTMIFEKTESSILWAEPSLDLTNELIRRYNGGEGGKSGAKK